MVTTNRTGVLVAVVVVLVLVLMAMATLSWPTYVFYNPSSSAPRGWYLRRSLRELRPGTLVLAHLPPAVAGFAERRGYLPRSVPILKRVGAVVPQHVCVRDAAVRIDGRAVAQARSRDGAGRPLSAWPGCRRLRPDEVFLLAAGNAVSFDGRYFGPVSRSAVFGEAVPLWTW